MKVVVAVFLGLVVGLASADTLTWKSTVTDGSFTDPNNWTSDGTHTTPQPGDTVKFTVAGVQVSSDTAFDTTGGGLTIDCDFYVSDDINANYSKGLKFAVALKGSGPVTKTGRGQMVTKKSWTTSGTITVNDGWFCMRGNTDWSGTYPIGTSKVVIDRTGGKDPQLFLFNNGAKLTNDFEVVGEAATLVPKASFAGSNDAGTFMGKITSSTDFTIAGGHCNAPSLYSNSRFSFASDVDATGRTMYLADCVGWATYITVAGNVNCSIEGTKGSGANNIQLFEFKGHGTAIDADLTLGSISNIFFNGATWAGTNVLVKAGKGLCLKGSDNLSPLATLTLESKAHLTIDSGVKAVVSRFVVNGVDRGKGVFTSADLPGVIYGTGSLEVIGATVSVWKGANYGDWGEASNWIPEQVPQAGALALFQYPVTNLTSKTPVDISNGGLILFCNFKTEFFGTEGLWGFDYNKGIRLRMTITGSGELVKDGFGQLLVESKILSTGGIRVKDGILGCRPVKDLRNIAFGTNKITIDRRLGGNPQVGVYNRYNRELVMNEVEIIGSGATPPVASLLAANDGEGFGGNLKSDSDFAIASGHCNDMSTRGWYQMKVNAPGHTMYLDSCASWGTQLYFGGEINCSINGANGQYASQIKLFEFAGKGTSVDADLVLASSNVFLSAATWAGTNVTLGANSKLFLNGKDNLSNKATLRLGAGSKLSIAKGVKVCVAECYANGTKVPDGVYSAANVPAALSGYWIGEGRLRVGSSGLMVIVR